MFLRHNSAKLGPAARRYEALLRRVLLHLPLPLPHTCAGLDSELQHNNIPTWVVAGRVGK